MALKRTTVMLDEADLVLIKQAAEREGRPEAEFIREAVHLRAVRARQWADEWDVPEFDFGGPIGEDEVRRVVADELAR